jgi:hypothetical protein
MPREPVKPQRKSYNQTENRYNNRGNRGNHVIIDEPSKPNENLCSHQKNHEKTIEPPMKSHIHRPHHITRENYMTAEEIT